MLSKSVEKCLSKKPKKSQKKRNIIIKIRAKLVAQQRVGLPLMSRVKIH